MELEVHCIYTAIRMCCAFQLTVCWLGWDGTGGTLYIHSNWYVLCFLVDCWPGRDGTGVMLYIHSNWYMLCFLFDWLLVGLGWNWRYNEYIQQLVCVVFFS